MRKVQPIWMQVVDNLMGSIRDNKYAIGEKLPTESELMERYGVSRNTVRKAVGCLDAMKAVEIRQGSGIYLVKSVLTEQCEKARIKIGAMLIDEGYFAKIISGMQNECARNDCELVVKFVDSHRTEVESVKQLLAEDVNVIIITPFRQGKTFTDSNYLFLQNNNIPFVMLGKPPSTVFCNAIYCEDILPSMSAVLKLKEADCKKIIHIYDSNLDSVAVTERLHGFMLGVEKYYGKKACKLLDIGCGDFNEKFEKILLDADEKIGIFLHADAYFKDVDRIVKDCGLRYGRDISVIGYGRDLSRQEILQGLTTFEIPKQRMGEEIIKQALSACANGNWKNDPVHHVVLKPEYIRGNTL